MKKIEPLIDDFGALKSLRWRKGENTYRWVMLREGRFKAWDSVDRVIKNENYSEFKEFKNRRELASYFNEVELILDFPSRKKVKTKIK